MNQGRSEKVVLFNRFENRALPQITFTHFRMALLEFIDLSSTSFGRSLPHQHGNQSARANESILGLEEFDHFRMNSFRTYINIYAEQASAWVVARCTSPRSGVRALIAVQPPSDRALAGIHSLNRQNKGRQEKHQQTEGKRV